MAIKIKNEGSAASRIAAKADGGRAKRAMEAAAFAKGRDIQQKQAATAHASAPSISAAPVGHAQLIGAPGAAPLDHAPSAGGLGASVRFGGATTGTGVLPAQRGGKIETQTQSRNPVGAPTVHTSRPYTTGQLTKQRPLADVGLGGFKTFDSKMHRRLGNTNFNKDQYDAIVAKGGTIFEDGSYILPNQSMTQAERIANGAAGGGGGGGGLARQSRRISSGGSSGGTSSAPMKTTASGRFNDPKDGSTYNPNTDSWSRPYLPGEYEAEAKERVGRVENDLYADRALTAQGQKERAALVNDIMTAIRNGKFSKEEQAQLMKEYGIADENIRMADALRDRDLTPEEQFRKNTFTDKNGIVFSPDGTVLYNPVDAEAKRKDTKEMQYVTMLQNFIASLENPITITEVVDGAAQDQNGDPIPGPVRITRFLTEDEKNAAIKRYKDSLSQFWNPQSGTAQPQAGNQQAQNPQSGAELAPEADLTLSKYTNLIWGKEPPTPDWLNPQTPEIGPNGPRASVPGFTPTPQGKADAPAPQGEAPQPAPQGEAPQPEESAQDDGDEDYSEYQED